MPLRPALLALALLALAAPGAQGAAGQRDRCNVPGVRTVALTSQLRVFQDRADGYYHGCERRTGRRTLLWEQDDLYVTGMVRVVAGRFAAYSVSSSPACKADCPPEVTGTWITSVTDVRTGRTRDLYDGHVYRVLLRPSGTVAWVAEARPDSVLSLWRLGAAATLLDTGDVHDVAVAGGRLGWANSDGPHSVSFR